MQRIIDKMDEETVNNAMREYFGQPLPPPTCDVVKLAQTWNKWKSMLFKKADGTPWNEHDNPGGMLTTMIRIKPLEDYIQIFMGTRVIGRITTFYLKMFKEGRGYEFIEEWKAHNFPFIKQLNGSQILHITELLRQYGHSKC
jgi:hypothetical protein